MTRLQEVEKTLKQQLTRCRISDEIVTKIFSAVYGSSLQAAQVLHSHMSRIKIECIYNNIAGNESTERVYIRFFTLKGREVKK